MVGNEYRSKKGEKDRKGMEGDGQIYMKFY